MSSAASFDTEVWRAGRTSQWWRPKAAAILGVVYAAILLSELSPASALVLLAPAVVTILGIGLLGHILNDWFDRELDAQAGKRNRLAELPPYKRAVFVLFALAAAGLPWLVLPKDSWSAVLLGGEFLLLLIYAAPPLRLKLRAWWAPPVDALYAYALPALLATHTFFLASGQQAPAGYYLALGAWQGLLGLRHYLNHLALDQPNDLQVGAPTLAVRYGVRSLYLAVGRWLLHLELLAIVGVLAAGGVLAPGFTTVGLLVLCGWAVLGIWWGGESWRSFWVYRFSGHALDRLAQHIWPASFLTVLLVVNWRFWPLAVVHALLFWWGYVPFRWQTFRMHARYLKYDLRNGYYRSLRFLSDFKWRSIRLGAHLRILASLVVNYSLYYFRTVVLQQDERRARRLAPDAPLPKNPPSFWQDYRASLPRNVYRFSLQKRRPLRVAIANINRSKYTETFINGMIGRLPMETYLLYGGEVPDHALIRHHPPMQWRPAHKAWLNWQEHRLRLPQEHFRQQALAAYLQKKRVKVVLAEFGPVGVGLLPVVRDLGLPLVVRFHGYDAHNRQTLEPLLSRYRELFAYPSAYFVGVSRAICERLLQWGVPAYRLHYLPAFANLHQFRPQPGAPPPSKRPPRILYTGRFADTKSPHLTLLAFARVLKRAPNAHLVMIGKGGGGELYEACLTLIKALGLEENVLLLGIQSHLRVQREMQRARVYVLNSVTTPETHDQEGTPVAAMEAMASGLPVVATRHAGLAEIITHEETGLLVPEYDLDALTGQLLRVLQDDALADRLGANASRYVHEHPRFTQHINRLSGILHAAAANS